MAFLQLQSSSYFSQTTSQKFYKHKIVYLVENCISTACIQVVLDVAWEGGGKTLIMKLIIELNLCAVLIHPLKD